MNRRVLVLLALLVGAFTLVVAQPAYACDCEDCKKDEKKAAPAPKSFDKPPALGTQATCPVMGGKFAVKKNTTRSEHKGKHYVFCCPGCKPKFDANPGKYTK
jgi:YHS domain-containing protein